MRRTQISLTADLYELLRAMSTDTGLSMSELVRRALERTYVERGVDALEESFGAWKGRRADGADYVERLRTGMAARLERTSVGTR